MLTKRTYLYTLSFLEGGAVMTAEVVGAKLLAPYFGTSLIVWAAALGVTLGGLMAGYFLGGLLSVKSQTPEKLMYGTLMLAGLFLMLMPWTSGMVLKSTLNMPLAWGSVMALSVFLLPPLICMGMISPLMVAILHDEKVQAGHGAGNVYAISTLGGILFTFGLGFFLIPAWGIRMPALLTGLLLSLLAAVGYGQMAARKQKTIMGVAWLLALSLSISFTNKNVSGLVFKKEGILGQIQVVDFNLPDVGDARALLVNQTLQTVEIKGKPSFRYWDYVDYMDKLIPVSGMHEKALLLGIGGGTLYKMLLEKGYNLHAVEFDEEIVKVARKYFWLPEKGQVWVDDARHFIKTAPHNTYDLVIMDVLKGESVPDHILTRESFFELKNILSAKGKVIINFYGYTEGRKGRAARSVIRTLESVGYNVKTFTTPGLPDQRNTLFLAQNRSDTDRAVAGILPVETKTADGFILTDDHPRADLFVDAATRWRILNNQWYQNTFIRHHQKTIYR